MSILFTYIRSCCRALRIVRIRCLNSELIDCTGSQRDHTYISERADIRRFGTTSDQICIQSIIRHLIDACEPVATEANTLRRRSRMLGLITYDK